MELRKRDWTLGKSMKWMTLKVAMLLHLADCCVPSS
jgi:hypothetical protein